jgi:hypothetical protein
MILNILGLLAAFVALFLSMELENKPLFVSSIIALALNLMALLVKLTR